MTWNYQFQVIAEGASLRPNKENESYLEQGFIW
jgi:hypothetical protein